MHLARDEGFDLRRIAEDTQLDLNAFIAEKTVLHADPQRCGEEGARYGTDFKRGEGWHGGL